MHRCDRTWSDDLISPSPRSPPTTPLGVWLFLCLAPVTLWTELARLSTPVFLPCARMHSGLVPNLPLHEGKKVTNDDPIDCSFSVVSTWRRRVGLFPLSTVAPAGTFCSAHVAWLHL